MEVITSENPLKLGIEAARLAAQIISTEIVKKGKARIVLSTGASQFETLEALINEKLDWSKVEMFHLDEYIGLPESHPASFRKYLKERFTTKVQLKNAFFVDGEHNYKEKMKRLSDELKKEPIDLALIGIGENAHIAFNDPPADFNTTDPYIIVSLNKECKQQQVREGWFSTVQDVPDSAISMSVYQIMQSKKIISVVPHRVKAHAIKSTIENNVTPEIPATILKTHPDWTLFLDKESASFLNI